ncbi:MAG: glycosyltransferase family 4 protein [Candidatus Stahlbacteria bacterium]|nr:glycosyltransferase family 4 protein [Candidatus Stahlbacteria bacterium]
MPKIKIAQVITRLDWGGAPDIIRIISNHLNPEIYDLKLITGPSKYPSAKTKEFLNKLNDRVIISPNLQRNINPLKDGLSLINLYRLFCREKFDIVHTHSSKAGFIGRISAKMAGAPCIIYTPHGHIFYGYFGYWLTQVFILLERVSALITDKIIALTGAEARDYEKFKVAPKEKLLTIHSGIEIKKFESKVNRMAKRKEIGIPESNLVVICVARLVPIKGHKYLIDAANSVLSSRVRCTSSEVTFLFAGDGPLKAELKYQVERLGLTQKILFLGERKDVAELLALSDIFAISSINEGMCRAIIEAMAAGLPVVATDVCGIANVVVNGKTGILVPPKSSEALEKAISLLINTPITRHSMGSAGKERAEKFTLEKMISKIDQLYTALKVKS